MCVCTPSLTRRDKKIQEKVNIVYLSSKGSFIKIKAVTFFLAQLPIANTCVAMSVEQHCFEKDAKNGSFPKRTGFPHYMLYTCSLCAQFTDIFFSWFVFFFFELLRKQSAVSKLK